MEQTYTDKPESDEAEAPQSPLLADDTGPFEADETGLIQYFKPSPEELAKLNADMLVDILDTRRADVARLEKVARNERAYEAVPDSSSGETPMIMVPTVRRDCDSTAAFFISSIMRPSPIFSFNPYFPADYQVPVDSGDPQIGKVMLETTAEKSAEVLQHAFDVIIRERFKFWNLLNISINEVVKGRGPAIFKVVQNDKSYSQYVTDISKGVFNAAMYNGVKKVTAETLPIKVYVIPTENFTMPADEESPAESRLTIERTPMRIKHFRKELRKKHCLIDQSEWSQIEGLTANVLTEHQKDMKSSIDGRYDATAQPNMHDLVEVFFDYCPDDDDEEVNLQGLYHVTAGKFLWIIKNPYNHQRPPYVALFQKKRAFRFSDSSTAEELAPLARLVSEILHNTLQNAIVANGTPVIVDPDSDAADHLVDHDIGPLSVIPGKKDEVTPINLGREYRTMMPEVQFLLDLGRTISRQSEYTDGSYVPGRTSPNTVDMIMKSGQQASFTQLLGMADSFCELARLILKTYKQFRPFGELFYIKDEETKQLLEIPFRLPDEEALDNIKISLTAADELAAQEATTEYLTMLANMLDKDAEEVAKIVGPMANPQMPDSIFKVLRKLVERKQEIVEALVDRTRSDSKRFTVSPQLLEAMQQERLMVQQQMKQQQAMAAQAQQGGAPNGQPPQVQPAGMAGPSPAQPQ